MKGMSRDLARFVVKWQNGDYGFLSHERGILPPDGMLDEALAMTRANGYDKELRGASLYRGFSLETRSATGAMRKILLDGGKFRVEALKGRNIESWTTAPTVASDHMQPAAPIKTMDLKPRIAFLASRRKTAKDVVALNLASERFWKDLDGFMDGGRPSRYRPTLKSRYRHRECEVALLMPKRSEYSLEDIEAASFYAPSAKSLLSLLDDVGDAGWKVSGEIGHMMTSPNQLIRVDATIGRNKLFVGDDGYLFTMFKRKPKK